MNTALPLMAHYEGQAVNPINAVCRDYFTHLTPDKLAQKIGWGEIRLPLIRIEDSQKAAKGLHLIDLAKRLDARRAAARRALAQLIEKWSLKVTQEPRRCVVRYRHLHQLGGKSLRSHSNVHEVGRSGQDGGFADECIRLNRDDES